MQATVYSPGSCVCLQLAAPNVARLSDGVHRPCSRTGSIMPVHRPQACILRVETKCKWCCSPPCARPGAVGINCCKRQGWHGFCRGALTLQQQELDAAGPQAHSSSDGGEIDGKRCHSVSCAHHGAAAVNCCEAPGVAQLHEQRMAPTTRRACC